MALVSSIPVAGQAFNFQVASTMVIVDYPNAAAAQLQVIAAGTEAKHISESTPR
jgi:hypothetical protein